MDAKGSREIIGGKRMCGKTTELIRKANKENLYILCPNKNMARFIFRQAQDMNLNIPYPITVDELPLRSPFIKEILVDEVEMVLERLIQKRVVGMSTSLEMKELNSIKR